MTFSARETSKRAGKPVYLLRLQRGAIVARYTSADRTISAGGFDYAPLAITRSEIEDSTESTKSVLTVTLPISVAQTAWWRPYMPSQRIGLTWMVLHDGDTDVKIEWTGRVIGPEFTDSQLVLRCEPTRTGARSRGLNLRWMRACPLALYSQGVGLCNVDPEANKVPALVDSLVGNALTCSEFSAAPKPLTGGFVRWTRTDGEIEHRSIMSHAGSTVVLLYGTDALPVGHAVDAFPGCPHDWAGCESYGNTANYGGAPNMPNKSPFNGNPL